MKKVLDNIDEETGKKYSAYNSIYSVDIESRIKNIFWGLFFVLIFILFVPWTQNINTSGIVTTQFQEQRPQQINSIIPGKIIKWWVKEGDFVQKGDTIVELADTKDDYLDPRLIERTNDQLIAKKQKVDFSLASCCSPIPGDEVFGFITVSDGIKIHRTNCSNAQELMSKYAYRVIKARWSNKELVQFEVGLKFAGIDDVGLVQKITNIISTDMNVNMKAISFEANNGIFQGKVVVLVHDTNHLGTLIDQLKAVEGVLTVDRIESEFA